METPCGFLSMGGEGWGLDSIKVWARIFYAAWVRVLKAWGYYGFCLEAVGFAKGLVGRMLG